jgi:hypothetical protein
MKIVRLDPAHHVYRTGKKAKKVLQPRAARHLGHPHVLKNGADLHRHPMPDEGKTRTPKPSQVTKGHSEVVERNLETLAEELPGFGRSEDERFNEKMAVVVAQEADGLREPLTPGRREQFVALETHRDMAAEILGAGGTFDEAADFAGVATTTVSKWYADREFRARVDEMKAIVKAKVGGRVLASLERLTDDADRLDAIPLKDRLALYDRFEPAGRAGPTSQTNVLITPYENLMGRLGQLAGRPETGRSVDDAAEEGSGFPVVGLDGPPVAG